MRYFFPWKCYHLENNNTPLLNNNCFGDYSLVCYRSYRTQL